MKRAIAWLPALFVPVVALVGPGLGCELLVDVDTTLLDGGPDDVVIPMTLDGYHCKICTDVSPDADFDGDDVFPTPEPKDSASENAASETSSGHGGGEDAGGDEVD